MPITNKSRSWWAVLYPENMMPDWTATIGDTLQLPYAYCIHTADKDSKSEHRKDHVHLIVVFPSPTTYNHAMEVFNTLSLPGQKALNTCEGVINIRHAYDYLIHDTETCRKLEKELYSPESRITGNNFDIGAFEQLGAAESDRILWELVDLIIDKGFTNFYRLLVYVRANYEDKNYLTVLKNNNNFLSQITKGQYQEHQEQKEASIEREQAYKRITEQELRDIKQSHKIHHKDRIY